MQGFKVNVAKSFIWKNVNLHLKDGSVIVNVRLAEIRKDVLKGEILVKCIPYGRTRVLQIPLRNIAWAKLLNLNLIEAGDRQSS
ncbi:MAG: hypothetical protein QXF53_01280 [Candidatus Bathyarchaeia archaeon]